MCTTLEADVEAMQEGRTGLDRQRLWTYSMVHTCWGLQHTKWALGLGVPLVVLLYLVLPVAVGSVLWLYRGRLTDAWVRQHFGFLYVHYRPGSYMWEVVSILQTLVVVVAATAASYLGAYKQALLVNVALAVIMIMLLWFKPMASRAVQLLNYASVGVQMFTTYAAMSFMPVSPAAAAQPLLATRQMATGDHNSSMSGFELYKLIMGVFVLAANAAFVVCVISVLVLSLPSDSWQAWADKVLAQLLIIRNAARQHCCSCSSAFRSGHAAHITRVAAALPAAPAAAPAAVVQPERGERHALGKTKIELSFVPSGQGGEAAA